MKIARLSLKNHTRIVVMAIIMVLAVICFFEIVEDVFSEPALGDFKALILDKAVLQKFHEMRSAELTQSMIDVTALGSISVIALFILITIIFLVIKKKWIDLAYIFIIATGSLIIPRVLKNHYMRERPDIIDHLATVKSHSFPSGHSFAATVAYFSLVYLVSREIKNVKIEILYYILAGIVISLVGISRMYLGVHYPTDVFAGISLGLIWFILVSIPFVFFSKQRVRNENL